MPTHTYHFFAPLSNATGHFSAIRLAKPFRIERWQKERIVRTWRTQEGFPRFHIEVRMDAHQCRIEEGQGHVITGALRLAHNQTPEGVSRFHATLEEITRPLAVQLRALRLYLCADVGLFDHYWYYQDGATAIPVNSSASDVVVSPLGHEVVPRELPGINRFIRRATIPLKHEYLQLAWDHWDQSFDANTRELALLSLVMALESLFNVGQTDLRYRVARAMAVLLGRHMDGAETIFDGIATAYDIRSKLVHMGKAEIKKPYFADTLRLYVQWAILKLIELDLPKQTVADILTRLPFGEADSISRRSVRLLTARNRLKRWKNL